jgi:hypothetical protein
MNTFVFAAVVDVPQPYMPAFVGGCNDVMRRGWVPLQVGDAVAGHLQCIIMRLPLTLICFVMLSFHQ